MPYAVLCLRTGYTPAVCVCTAILLHQRVLLYCLLYWLPVLLAVLPCRYFEMVVANQQAAEQALELYSDCVRWLLLVGGGYECQVGLGGVLAHMWCSVMLAQSMHTCEPTCI